MVPVLCSGNDCYLAIRQGMPERLPAKPQAAHPRLSAASTASATSTVPALPPRSGVRGSPAFRHGRHRPPQRRRALLQTQMIQQHPRRQDRRQRIRDALAGNVRRGAMHRLEHARKRPLRIDVGAGRQSHAAGDDGAEVGQDVAEEIAGDHHVERLRLAHEIHGRRIDEQRAGLHVGIVALHVLEGLVPQDHAERLGVRLGDGRELLAAFARRPRRRRA